MAGIYDGYRQSTRTKKNRVICSDPRKVICLGLGLLIVRNLNLLLISRGCVSKTKTLLDAEKA